MASVMMNGHWDTSREEMERFLNDVSSIIDINIIDWKKIARRLKLPERCIEIIDADCQKIEEKFHQALMKWFHMYGHSRATKEVLIEALREESNVIADEICKLHNIPGIEFPAKPPQKPTQETSVDDTAGDVEIVLSFSKELTILLNNSQDNLETCDSATLIERQINLNHLHNMEQTLSKMIGNIERKTLKSATADLIRKEKWECCKRILHTTQIQHLIQYLLETRTKRPKSEVPRRSTSFADPRLNDRSNTYSPGDYSTTKISSPSCLRKKEA